MDWTSSARVRLLVGVPPLGLRFLLFGAEKSALRSRNFPTALALDFHHYPLYGQKYVWGLLRFLSCDEFSEKAVALLLFVCLLAYL